MKIRPARAPWPGLVAWLATAALLASAVGPVAAEPSAGEVSAPARAFSYVVQPGDTWVRISKIYGVSAGRLIDINNLRKRPHLLFVGETIIIPIDLGTTPSLVSPFLYTVQPGDTVQTVVNSFFIDKFALLQANRLPSGTNLLTAGQQLLVPAGPHRYVVQRGDSLEGVAAMFATTAGRLLQFNPHLGGVLFAGAQVYVPIAYDITFSPIVAAGPGAGGTGGGGGAALPGSGLSPVMENAGAVASAANANVIIAFEFITMPSHIVDLNQPLKMRWFRLNGVRRDPARHDGAVATVVIQFRGGTGSYTLRHFVTNPDGSVAVKGLAMRGVYVNPGEGELWNDLEFEVSTTCESVIAETVIFSSGSITIQARYEYKATCPSS